MKHHARPVSDRVRAALTGEDPQLIREVEALERLAAAGTAHAVANNKNPKDWPLERWLLVLTFSMGLSASIVTGLWFLGGEWKVVQDAVATVPMLVQGQAVAQKELGRIGGIVQDIQDEQQRLRALVASPLRPTVRRPSSAFPRDEQFYATEPRP